MSRVSNTRRTASVIRSLETQAIRELAPFLEALARLTDDGTLVVAGVDFSHVGPKFGDEDSAAALEKDFRSSDRRILEALEAGDADNLYETIARDGNQFNVCGFSALWTLLAALPGMQGHVLDYTVWHEDATRSAVSFAAVSFTEKS